MRSGVGLFESLQITACAAIAATGASRFGTLLNAGPLALPVTVAFVDGPVRTFHSARPRSAYLCYSAGRTAPSWYSPPHEMGAHANHGE